MGPGLLRRVRWGNVGRLAGALAVIAAVAAWPRLAPPEPALPGDLPRPLDGLASPTATPPAELLVPRPPRAVRRQGGRERRARGRDGSGETRPDERSGRQAQRDETTPERRSGGSGEVRRGDRGTEPDPIGGPDTDARQDGDGADRRRSPPGGDPAQTEFGFESG